MQSFSINLLSQRTFPSSQIVVFFVSRSIVSWDQRPLCHQKPAFWISHFLLWFLLKMTCADISMQAISLCWHCLILPFPSVHLYSSIITESGRDTRRGGKDAECRMDGARCWCHCYCCLPVSTDVCFYRPFHTSSSLSLCFVFLLSERSRIVLEFSRVVLKSCAVGRLSSVGLEAALKPDFGFLDFPKIDKVTNSLSRLLYLFLKSALYIPTKTQAILCTHADCN